MIIRPLLAATAVATVAVGLAPEWTRDVAAIGQPPRAGAPALPALTLPPVQEADLANGLHVMVLEDRSESRVSFQILVIGAGGYYDPPGQRGLARFTAAMLRDGTATRTGRQVAERLGALRATLDVSTGMANQAATLSASSLAQNFSEVLELAADILLRPEFRAEDLARYKQRTRAELVQQQSSPSSMASDVLARVLHGSHPAGFNSPTLAALEKTTREDLVAFHRARYVPDYAVIGIAGDISMAEARKLVDARLAAWKKAGGPRPATEDPPPPAPAKVTLADAPSAAQTTLVLGAQVMNRTSPDYVPLFVLNDILGGPTGRLSVSLQGYSSGVQSGITALNYSGNWRASTVVGADVTETAVRALLDELARVREAPVPQVEFEQAKRSIVGAFADSLDSPAAVLANHIIRWAYCLPADFWDRYPERIMAVSVDEVQAVAKKYLDPARLRIVAVGDAKTIAAGLEKFGPVERYSSAGTSRARSKSLDPRVGAAVGARRSVQRPPRMTVNPAVALLARADRHAREGVRLGAGRTELRARVTGGEELRVQVEVRATARQSLHEVLERVHADDITRREVARRAREVEAEIVRDAQSHGVADDRAVRRPRGDVNVPAGDAGLCVEEVHAAVDLRVRDRAGHVPDRTRAGWGILLISAHRPLDDDGSPLADGRRRHGGPDQRNTEPEGG